MPVQSSPWHEVSKNGSYRTGLSEKVVFPRELATVWSSPDWVLIVLLLPLFSHSAFGRRSLQIRSAHPSALELEMWRLDHFAPRPASNIKGLGMYSPKLLGRFASRDLVGPFVLLRNMSGSISFDPCGAFGPG